MGTLEGMFIGRGGGGRLVLVASPGANQTVSTGKCSAALACSNRAQTVFLLLHAVLSIWHCREPLQESGFLSCMHNIHGWCV